ncbi:MAG: exopolysaccharide biosynthesis polyprenyl glycosylphosphotransferase [Sulfurifustis sp.]
MRRRRTASAAAGGLRSCGSSRRRAVFAVFLRPRLHKRILILGTTPLAQALVELIGTRARRGRPVVGVVSEQRTDGSAAGTWPLLGALADLPRIIDEFQPEQIVVALTERRADLPWDPLLQARICRGAVIEDGEELYERLTGKLAIDSLAPSDVIFSTGFRPSGPALIVGRAISVLAAVVGLVGFAPLLALIALAIKLDSRGPVLFIQHRVGRDARIFPLLKFRSMHPAAEQRTEWERDNGDRITRVGRWLRKLRLDELPQFINVLRGDMNLVGPRPHPASNFELFALVSRNIPQCGKKIPYYSLRTLVRPGITGWAQVRYRYANDLDEEMEKLRYDLYYIKHLSIGLDLRILLATLRATWLRRHRDAGSTPPARTVESAPLREAIPAAAGAARAVSAGDLAPEPEVAAQGEWIADAAGRI